MNKKKIIIIACAVIAVLGLVFVAIKLTGSNNISNGGVIKTDKGKVKIVKNEVSQITLEDYENDALSMKKPKGWEVTYGGDGMYYTISVYDKENPINKIYLMIKIQPLLKSDSAKKAWQDYAALSGTPSTYKIYTTSVVLKNPIVNEFYSKFNDIADFLKGIDSTYSTVKFPYLNSFEVIEEFESNASMKSYAMDSKVLRATFKDEKNNNGEGMFMASIVNFGNGYNLGMDTTYYMVYDIYAITSEKDKFIDYEDILTKSINSIEFKSSYVNKTIENNNAETANALKLSASVQAAFDSYMDAWEKRSSTYDIMSQKQSDATLGYERVYDVETNEIYKAYNGFTDDYKGERYKSISEDMYTKKTDGYIEKIGE